MPLLQLAVGMRLKEPRELRRAVRKKRKVLGAELAWLSKVLDEAQGVWVASSMMSGSIVGCILSYTSKVPTRIQASSSRKASPTQLSSTS